MQPATATARVPPLFEKNGCHSPKNPRAVSVAPAASAAFATSATSATMEEGGFTTRSKTAKLRKEKELQAITAFGDIALGIPPDHAGTSGNIQGLCRRPDSSFRTKSLPRGDAPFRATSPQGKFHSQTSGSTEREVFCNLRHKELKALVSSRNGILDHLWLLAKALTSCMTDTDMRSTHFAVKDEHFREGMRRLSRNVVDLFRIMRKVMEKHRGVLPRGMYPFIKLAKQTWENVKTYIDPSLPLVPTREYLMEDGGGGAKGTAKGSAKGSAKGGGGGSGVAADVVEPMPMMPLVDSPTKPPATAVAAVASDTDGPEPIPIPMPVPMAAPADSRSPAKPKKRKSRGKAKGRSGSK